jgi:hypothetical protein
LYSAAITSVKNYGSATFHLDIVETPDGDWLDGGKARKLAAPADVPADDLRAVRVYDLVSAWCLRDVAKSSVVSNQTALQLTADGSVDIHFGPTPPDGKAGNWIPTTEGRRFFLLFRFHGPQQAAEDGNWQQNDIERVD